MPRAYPTNLTLRQQARASGRLCCWTAYHRDDSGAVPGPTLWSSNGMLGCCVHDECSLLPSSLENQVALRGQPNSGSYVRLQACWFEQQSDIFLQCRPVPPARSPASASSTNADITSICQRSRSVRMSLEIFLSLNFLSADTFEVRVLLHIPDGVPVTISTGILRGSLP